MLHMESRRPKRHCARLFAFVHARILIIYPRPTDHQMVAGRLVVRHGATYLYMVNALVICERVIPFFIS